MEMKTTIVLLFAALLIGSVNMALAADLTAQPPVEIRVQLGDKDKLVLHNPSPVPHYFSSEGLARAVFTRKAQVLGADGKTLAEIKGNIVEIEVYPGATAEWWFVPVKAGKINDLKCTIKGHAEKGMVGTITVK